MTTDTHMPDVAAGVRRFTHRPTVVAAVQYDGTTESETELAALLGSHFNVFKGEEAAVLTTRYGWRALLYSDWAVLGSGGLVSIISAADFAERYAEVAHV